MEFSDPSRDWTHFQQGPLSDEAWRHFKRVVELCHAYKDRDERAKRIRKSPPREGGKQRSEWRQRIKDAENDKMRTAYLVA